VISGQWPEGKSVQSVSSAFYKNGGRGAMTEQQNHKQDVPTELLDYAKSNFDLYAADFNHLDNKAIGVLGITGLLVSLQAASLDNATYFFRSITDGKCSCLICFGMLVFVVYAISLVCCIIFALRSFQVRQLDYPSNVMEHVENFRKNNDTEEASAKLKVDIVKTYADSTNDIGKNNHEKAKHLKRAVWCICNTSAK
jgi:hypothetical protein